jgi:hypothetical protein
MESAGLAPAQLTEPAESRTRDMALHLHQNVKAGEPVRLLFMGREMQFAAARLRRGAPSDPAVSAVTRLPLHTLDRLADSVLRESLEEEVRLWQLSYPDAELLAPTLCMARSIAQMPH